MKTNQEKLNEINKLIDDGLDTKGLIRVRNRLYKLDEYALSAEESLEKHAILKCINEMLAEDRS